MKKVFNEYVCSDCKRNFKIIYNIGGFISICPFCGSIDKLEMINLRELTFPSVNKNKLVLEFKNKTPVNIERGIESLKAILNKMEK